MLETICQKILERAKIAGAEEADVLGIKGTSTSIEVRNQTLEQIERSEGTEFGLRVFIGKRQAIVSGSDLSDNLMPDDPASIKFAIEGSTILDEGLTSEAIIENQNLDPLDFGQILHFKLKEFLLNALGITVEANGRFEFDNADLETFEGIPRPMGTASLRIKGSNAFIDRLENMQVLPSETIMGARMMLALIMRATGDDILSSEFEIDEKGKVYANGQRLR